MRVLGVDPGTAVVGFGVVDTHHGLLGRLVECGVIRTRPSDPLPQRLQVIYEGMQELLRDHRPDVVAVEGIFYGANARTMGVLGHARGVILLAAAEAQIDVAEYSPATVKKTVVNQGAARKEQVGYVVAKLLKLSHPPTPHDAADGVAVALTHLMRQPPRQRKGGAR